MQKQVFVCLFSVLLAGSALMAQEHGDSNALPMRGFFLSADGRLSIVPLPSLAHGGKMRAVNPGYGCKVYWYDEDGDGVGAGPSLMICGSGAPPPGYVPKGGDCDPKNPNVFQLVLRLVRDADRDLYTPDLAPTTQCVGDSIIAVDENGNPYAQWWKSANGQYEWLGAEFSRGFDPDDANPLVPGHAH